MSKPLKLPRNSARKRAENKTLWNEARSAGQAEFFTTGYEGRPAEQLTSLLCDAGVKSVIDIRFSPVSMYRPEMSKSNFRERIHQAGLQYLHVPELGVPRDIRAKAISTQTRDTIWQWYDSYVVERFLLKKLHWFLNIEHPVALLCVECDPTECHRHRLFLELERQGLQGFDL